MKMLRAVDSWVIRHLPVSALSIVLFGVLLAVVAKIVVQVGGADIAWALLAASIALVGYGSHMLVQDGSEMNAIVDQASREGFRVRLDEHGLEENPYHRLLERHAFKAWREGWMEAHTAIRSLKLLR
jgi:hypothetical protein